MPKRFWNKTKKNAVIRNGRYLRVSATPSTGVSISSRRYTIIASNICGSRPLVM